MTKSNSVTEEITMLEILLIIIIIIIIIIILILLTCQK